MVNTYIIEYQSSKDGNWYSAKATGKDYLSAYRKICRKYYVCKRSGFRYYLVEDGITARS